MPSLECVFIGDLHLNAFGNLFPDISKPNELLFETLKQPLEYARQNGIKTIIILGDIFDNEDPDQVSQADLFHWLYANKSFDIYMIPGNHDYSLDESDESKRGAFSLEITDFITKLKLLPHVRLYTSRSEEHIDGIPFTFMPWPIHKRKKNKYATVNIAHVPRIGAMSDSGRKFKDGEAYELDTKRDYWYVGDLHRYQSYDRCIYPGTLYQKTFGEPLPKGFIHADISLSKSGKLKCNNKFVPIEPVFRLLTVRVNELSDLRAIERYDVTSRPINRYKLILGKDVGLPANFLDNNPHVVKWDKQSKLRTIEDLGETVQISEIKEIDLNELIYGSLPAYLEKDGLSKKQIKRGRIIIDSIVRKIEARS